MLPPDIEQDNGDEKKGNNGKRLSEPGDIQRAFYVIIIFNSHSNSTSRYFHFPHFTDETKDCTQGHTAVEAGFAHR